MTVVARLLLVPVGLLLALLAFVHSASETGRLILPVGFFGRSGIDAHVTGEFVDRLFRAEMRAQQAHALAEQGQLSEEEIATLAADPVALQRFIEERQTLAQSEPDHFPRISDDLLRQARLSYASDPLNVATLRTIALGHALHEDSDRARKLMHLAVRISKRDEITNLWLAQDYGRQGDLVQMLATFDHALRTSRRAREGSMALVVRALDSEEGHVLIGNLLRADPEWQNAFWVEFARNPVSLANAENFFLKSGIPLEKMPERFRGILYTNLKRVRYYNTLFDLARLEPEASRGQHAGAKGFGPSDGVNPLEWTPYSRGTFAARVHQASGELQIDARAGAFGLAADRIVRGGDDFRMVLEMAEAVPPNAELKLTAVCADADRQRRSLGEIVLSSSQVRGTTAVQARDCAFINLELGFDVDEGRQDSLIRVANISFEPL